MCSALKKQDITPFMQIKIVAKLSAEAIQSPALPLQSIDYVHRSHSLPLGMLSVGDSVSDHILQEDLKTAFIASSM